VIVVPIFVVSALAEAGSRTKIVIPKHANLTIPPKDLLAGQNPFF